MKEHTFDARIVAAAPPSEHTNTFIKETMKQITRGTLTDRLPTHRKNSLAHWLPHLTKPAIAVIAFGAIILLGSAVYAAIHFAPAFIQMLGKETNTRGATEYSVSGFAQCSARDESPIPERFEIKQDAPQMDDEEVRKIVQAKCELKWLETFPEKNWPKQGSPNPEKQDGDVVVYARLDMLGNLESLDAHNLVLTAEHYGTRTYPALPGEPIKTFAGGEEVALSGINKSDAVFAIARYSEPDRNWNMAPNKNGSAHQPEQPKLLGAVATFKMSLPLDYYREKQGYLTEIPLCMGHEQELCPQTQSIDVYPRSGGEGPVNPYQTPHPNDVFREISGEVTQLTGDSLTLKARSGTLYHVTVGDNGFTVYNRDYTGPYTQTGIDAHLKIGSHVAVRYSQSQGADRTHITKEQVHMVSLQLEALNIKNGGVKQY